MAQERTERYSKIKSWLGDCFEQKPSPHKILSQMLVEEQTLTNRLTNTGQPWSMSSFALNVQSGVSEYNVNSGGGKVYFVVRQANGPGGRFMPVPYNDYSQRGFTEYPSGATEWVGENWVGSDSLGGNVGSIAFYRSSDSPQTLKAFITPAPQISDIYTISFFTGTLDRLQAAMEASGIATELSDYMDLRAAIALLPYAFWRQDNTKENIEYNRERRKELATGLLFQLQGGMVSLEKVVDDYIKNINAPVSFSIGHWND